jgi:hypothetical protein
MKTAIIMIIPRIKEAVAKRTSEAENTISISVDKKTLLDAAVTDTHIKVSISYTQEDTGILLGERMSELVDAVEEVPSDLCGMIIGNKGSGLEDINRRVATVHHDDIFGVVFHFANHKQEISQVAIADADEGNEEDRKPAAVHMQQVTVCAANEEVLASGVRFLNERCQEMKENREKEKRENEKPEEEMKEEREKEMQKQAEKKQRLLNRVSGSSDLTRDMLGYARFMSNQSLSKKFEKPKEGMRERIVAAFRTKHSQEREEQRGIKVRFNQAILGEGRPFVVAQQEEDTGNKKNEGLIVVTEQVRAILNKEASVVISWYVNGITYGEYCNALEKKKTEKINDQMRAKVEKQTLEKATSREQKQGGAKPKGDAKQKGDANKKGGAKNDKQPTGNKGQPKATRKMEHRKDMRDGNGL